MKSQNQTLHVNRTRILGGRQDPLVRFADLPWVQRGDTHQSFLTLQKVLSCAYENSVSGTEPCIS